MTTVKLKKGDDLPEIEATLTGSDGTAVDLTGSSVQFRFRNADGGDATTGSATVIDAEAGKVKYDWQDQETAEVGDYVGEWVVTTGGGLVLTFPGDKFITFEIIGTL